MVERSSIAERGHGFSPGSDGVRTKQTPRKGAAAMAETAQGDTLIDLGAPSAVTPTVVWRDDPITPPQGHVPRTVSLSREAFIFVLHSRL